MIPIQKVKSYLNISSSEHDALLAIILERTVDLAESYLSSPLERRRITRLKQVENGKIWLDEIQPNVTKVEVFIGGEFQEVDYQQTGQIVSLYSVWAGTAKVEMLAGWQQIPSSLEFAIIKEVALEFLKSQQGEGRLGKQSVSDSLGGRGVSTSYTESDFYKELLFWRTR